MALSPDSHPVQNLAENVAAQEVAALLSINAQRVNLAQEQNIIVQAPEDSKDVVAAAKRVISQNRVNALGLRDQRDMTRLIAQSALQVGADSLKPAMFAEHLHRPLESIDSRGCPLFSIRQGALCVSWLISCQHRSRIPDTTNRFATCPCPSNKALLIFSFCLHP